MTPAAREASAGGTPDLDELLALYRSPLAQRLYDEVVTELDHALQAAALARADSASDELVAAALLHDIGHLVLTDMVPLETRLETDGRHEVAGARYLAQWFGPSVTAPVALHVAAKRYLCAVESDYVDALSPASIRSLALQGGPLNEREVEAFEADAHHRAAVDVRRWDDQAKQTAVDVPSFDEYESLLRELASRSTT